MVRIDRTIGASPKVLGSIGSGRDQISVGLWAFSEEAQARVAKAADLAPEQIQAWFDHAFGAPAEPAPLAMSA